MSINKTTSTPYQQLFYLSMVLLTAMACAFLIAAFFMTYYGPSGSYLAKNTLLSPEIAKLLRYQEIGTNKTINRYVFDGIEFSYFDDNEKGWHHEAMNLAQYSTLYTMMEQDKSLSEVSKDMVAMFNDPKTAAVKIKVKLENGLQASKPFQTIQFFRDYYRVQLRQAEGPREWAYFYHSRIYQELLNLIRN